MSGVSRSFSLPKWVQSNSIIPETVQLEPHFTPPLFPSVIKQAIMDGTRRILPRIPQKVRRVLIIVEDASRPTQTAPVIYWLTKELQKHLTKGVSLDLLVAGGAHVGLDNHWKVPKIFPGNVWVNRTEDTVYLGDLTNGPLWLHKAIPKADLRIALGTVNIHSKAGFSGGSKILLPGTAGLPTIFSLHSLPEGVPGQADTPMRRLADEVLHQYPVDFSLQFISDDKGRICQLFSGELHVAWQAAIQHLLPCVRREFDKPVANCLVDAGPFDGNLLGIFKSLNNIVSVLKSDGEGTILIRANQGLGGHLWRLHPVTLDQELYTWTQRLENRHINVVSEYSIPTSLWSQIFPHQLCQSVPDNRLDLDSNLPLLYLSSAPLLKLSFTQKG